MRKALMDKDMLAETETFLCQGSFKFIAAGHPNTEDLEKAKAFARKWMSE